MEVYIQFSAPIYKVDMSSYLRDENYSIILKSFCQVAVYYCEELLSCFGKQMPGDPEIIESVLNEIEIVSSIMDYCNLYLEGHCTDFSIPRWFLIGFLQYVIKEKIWELLSFTVSLIKNIDHE